MIPTLKNIFLCPLSPEYQIGNALAEQDTLPAKVLLALGNELEYIEKIKKLYQTNHPDLANKISKTFNEVENWYKSNQKEVRVLTVLNEIFTLAESKKAEADLTLFISEGGTFHQINDYLANKKPTKRDLPVFLDVIRRTILLENQFLQAQTHPDFAKKCNNEAVSYNSTEEIQKTDNILHRYLTSDERVNLLHYCCQHGLQELAVQLIVSGTPVDAVSDKGSSSLHMAAWTGDVAIAEMLLSKCAKVDIKNWGIVNPVKKSKSGDCTPLHLAASQGHLKIVKLLIKHGADINLTCGQGKAPIHYALDKEDIDTIKFLLESNANVNAQNNNGLTPLHYACLAKRADLIRLLLRYGADPLICNNFQKTPFETMQNNECREALKELFTDFPIILELLEEPIEQLLPKLRQEPTLLLEDNKDFHKRNPLEAVLFLGDRELAQNIARQMDPNDYQKALDQLGNKYHKNSFKFLVDASVIIKKQFIYQMGNQSEIPAVPPMDLNQFISLFKGIRFKYMPKLKEIRPEEVLVDKEGNLWTVSKFNKASKLQARADEFLEAKIDELQITPDGIKINFQTIPFLIMKCRKRQFPVVLTEENGVKKIKITIEMLLALYDRINFTKASKPGYRDPKTINDSTGLLGTERKIVPLESLAEGLETFVKLIKFRIPYASSPTPENPKELEEYYKYLEGMTLNVIRKILEEDIQARNDLKKIARRYKKNPSDKNLKKKIQAEKMLTPSGSSVITYGISGLHCGTRFYDDNQFLYDLKMNLLKSFQEQVSEHLDRFKLGIVESLINKNNIDNVHEKVKILQMIDLDAGIPESEKNKKIHFKYAKYDPSRVKLDQARIIKSFWNEFNPTKIIDLIEEPINEKSELFNAELVFQWYKDNTPPNWEKEKYSKIRKGLCKCKSTEEKTEFLSKHEIFINPIKLQNPKQIKWSWVVEEDRSYTFREKMVFDKMGKYKREAIAYMLSEFGVLEKVTKPSQPPSE